MYKKEIKKFRLVLRPTNKILDEIYAHPESFFSRAKLLRREDNSYKTRSEISDLVNLFARQYLVSVLRKNKTYIDPYVVSTYNGRDLFEVLKKEYITEENNKEIFSVIEEIPFEYLVLYIDDLCEDKGLIYINMSYPDLGYNLKEFEEQIVDFREENYIFARK